MMLAPVSWQDALSPGSYGCSPLQSLHSLSAGEMVPLRDKLRPLLFPTLVEETGWSLPLFLSASISFSLPSPHSLYLNKTPTYISSACMVCHLLWALMCCVAP